MLYLLFDFSKRDHAPGSHTIGDQRGVRPLETRREAVNPVARIEIAVVRHGRQFAGALPHTDRQRARNSSSVSARLRQRIASSSAATIGSILSFGMVSPS